jgi:hypothetical protein
VAKVRVQLILEGDYLVEDPPIADPWAEVGANEGNSAIHSAVLRAGVDVITDLNPKIFHQKFVVRERAGRGARVGQQPQPRGHPARSRRRAAVPEHKAWHRRAQGASQADGPRRADRDRRELQLHGAGNDAHDENIIVLGDLEETDPVAEAAQRQLTAYALTEIERIISDLSEPV